MTSHTPATHVFFHPTEHSSPPRVATGSVQATRSRTRRDVSSVVKVHGSGSTPVGTGAARDTNAASSQCIGVFIPHWCNRQLVNIQSLPAPIQGPAGGERATGQGVRNASTHLPAVSWREARPHAMWRCGGSNPVPPACKAGALPSELHPRTGLVPGAGGASWTRTRGLSLIRTAL